MSTAAFTCFQHLKEDVATTARQACPANPPDIRTWKGEDIRCFQEDLAEKVNGRVSEKWFYTHFKADRQTVPRVDMLDLLSRYVGYGSWKDYRQQHTVSAAVPTTTASTKYRIWFGFAALALLLGGLLGAYRWTQRPVTYQFCLMNAYDRQPVSPDEVSVRVLLEGESPYRLPVDAEGCLTVTTRSGRVRLVVRSSYYKNDTLVRVLDKANPTEQVALETDDYAWMLRLFSSADVADWQQRRGQLDAMLAPDARIYQLFAGQAVGMELYNKQEFINKLTMPLRSLRQIEVLDIRYAGDRIQVLRFKQKDDITTP